MAIPSPQECHQRGILGCQRRQRVQHAQQGCVSCSSRQALCSSSPWPHHMSLIGLCCCEGSHAQMATKHARLCAAGGGDVLVG
eukprot:1021857-Pelagomonas_calceolata.AAC.1